MARRKNDSKSACKNTESNQGQDTAVCEMPVVINRQCVDSDADAAIEGGCSGSSEVDGIDVVRAASAAGNWITAARLYITLHGGTRSVNEYISGFSKFVPWHVAARRARGASYDIHAMQMRCAQHAIYVVGLISGDNVSLRAKCRSAFDVVKSWVNSHPDASMDDRRRFAEAEGIKIKQVHTYVSKINRGKPT